MEYVRLTEVQIRPEGADEFELVAKMLDMLSIDYTLDDNNTFIAVIDVERGRV